MTDAKESSIGYYNRADGYVINAGDLWVSGINCWGIAGYTIGNTVVGVCLTVNSAGTVEMPYKITTPEIKILNTNGTLHIKNSLDASIAEFYDDKRLVLNGDVYLINNLFVNNINILDTLNLKAAASDIYIYIY